MPSRSASRPIAAATHIRIIYSHRITSVRVRICEHTHTGFKSVCALAIASIRSGRKLCVRAHQPLQLTTEYACDRTGDSQICIRMRTTNRSNGCRRAHFFLRPRPLNEFARTPPRSSSGSSVRSRTHMCGDGAHRYTHYPEHIACTPHRARKYC